jgi:glycosyltransferase involved in cell wall biosynthesis
MEQKTTISLIISTYNSPAVLELILLSVLQQKKLPDEVIIADDGSTDETRKLVAAYKAIFPVPLIHVWHEDNGFQLAAIKNKAAAKASGDYFILIDGDLLLHPYFIYDYSRSIRRGHFLVGSRAFLSETYTKQILGSKQTLVDNSSKHFEKNKIAAYRISWLHRFVKGNKTYAGARGILGIFREDYIKANGFNELFKGWGREDSEFFVRLLNSGLKRDNIKFAAITYHLWHPVVSRASLPVNDALLAQAIKEKSTRCEMGISRYL